MMKIVSFDPILLFPEHKEALNKLGELILHDTFPKDNNETIERLKDADIVIDFWTAMPAEVISKLTTPKMICSAAAGYDWIDVKAATEKGIKITHCPGHNAESVAEHTVGLMLDAMRLTKKASLEAKDGKYKPDEYKGKELKDSTVGIIGHGAIGKRVEEILTKGFGAKVTFIDSKSSKEDFENLLKTSDVISINAPLNDQTRNMFSFDQFDLMKDGVVIVNTGRGAIIDEAALIKNLESGKVFAAGLDILTQEPFDKNNKLLSMDNVIVTPHIAWNTNETDYRLSAQIVEIVEAFIKGEPKFIVKEQR